MELADLQTTCASVALGEVVALVHCGSHISSYITTLVQCTSRDHLVSCGDCIPSSPRLSINIQAKSQVAHLQGEGRWMPSRELSLLQKRVRSEGLHSEEQREG